jgi:hypothetical protein
MCLRNGSLTCTAALDRRYDGVPPPPFGEPLTARLGYLS